LVRDGVTGFHVPDRDAKALAEKVELLLSNEMLRLRLGRRAVCWAESYGWSAIADRVLDVFHDVTSVQMVAAGSCGS
jgi:glycosyltransferase involved in cell wall biosynthesis